MKYRLTLSLLAVVSAPLMVLAEEDKPAVTDERLGKMQQQLQLSDEQVAKMRQIRDEGGTTKDMRAVLTDEQRAKVGSKPKSSLTDERLSEMQMQLELSDEQIAKMRQILEDGGTRKDVLAVLTNDQQAALKKMKKKHERKTDADKEKAKAKSGDAEPVSQT